MHDFGPLGDSVIILIAAIAIVYVFHRLKVSPVLGYLAAGVLIGPYALSLISHREAVATLGELGVVFLLFIVGLELSFRRLAAMRTEVFGLGSAQVFITAGLAMLGLIGLGVGWKAALVIGFGIAMSSTAVVLQVLSDRGEMSSRMGRTAFSILLLQDLAIIPLLAIAPLLGDASQERTDWAKLALAFGTAAAALAVILLVGRYVLQPLFRAVAGMRRPELFVGITLLVVLGTAWATETVGLSLTLGAFLAGLMLAETEFRHQIEVELRPFEGLLLGLFFVTIGMTIDLGFALRNWWQVALLLLGLIAIKATVITLICRIINLPLAVALRTGLLLAQASEFAFVLVAIAAREKIVPAEIRQMVLAVASLSMAATPFLVIAGRALAEKLEKSAKIGLAALEQEHLDLGEHVVIAGFGRFGQMIARLLNANRIPYVALDLNAARVGKLKQSGVPVSYGDAQRPEILWGVGIDRAQAIVITAHDDAAGEVRLVRQLRERLPNLVIVARARDGLHANALKAAGATAAVQDALASSLHLAQSVMRSVGLPEGDLNAMVLEYGEREIT